MTTNQIEYLKLLETQRANRASEDLTKIRDQGNLELGSRNASETERHNRSTEGISLSNQQEAVRHNLATESLGYLNANETARHNLAGERETNRSNLVREAETNRANLAQEEIGRQNIAAKYADIANQAAMNTERVNFNYQQLEEQQWLNRANIGNKSLELKEQSRANQSREKETARHNKQEELYNSTFKRLDLTEQARHNRENEEIARINANSNAVRAGTSVAQTVLIPFKGGNYYGQTIQPGQTVPIPTLPNEYTE